VFRGAGGGGECLESVCVCPESSLRVVVLRVCELREKKSE